MGSLGRILGKVEEDGYITIGQAPSGVFKERFPVDVQAKDKR